TVGRIPDLPWRRRGTPTGGGSLLPTARGGAAALATRFPTPPATAGPGGSGRTTRRAGEPATRPRRRKWRPRRGPPGASGPADEDRPACSLPRRTPGSWPDGTRRRGRPAPAGR